MMEMQDEVQGGAESNTVNRYHLHSEVHWSSFCLLIMAQTKISGKQTAACQTQDINGMEILGGCSVQG